MKKLMVAAAAAVTATIGFSVESSNIVGYNTITAPSAGHYVTLGVKFNNVGENPNFTVNTLFTYTNPAKAPGYGNTADAIWIWDPTLNDGAGSWAKYYYNQFKNGFVASSASGPTATLATTPVEPGATILFFRGTSAASSSTVTLAGGVEPLTGIMQHTVAPGKYKFVCYPWPIAFNVNQIAACQTTPAKAPGYGNTADAVWLWDSTLNDGAGSWAKYYYSQFKNGYVVSTASGPTAPLANVSIPAGEGFLFFRGTAGSGNETITFKGPNYVEP